MRVTIKYTGQNHRRYRRPWIAKVTEWGIGKKPILEFGEFLGTVNGGGEVEIEANSGDVIRHGQKDMRDYYTSSLWAIVQNDGTLETVTEVQAKKAWILCQIGN